MAPPSPGTEDRSDVKTLQLVGLARRAGRAVAGTQAVRDAGRRGELRLILVAGDVTENARRRVSGVLADPAVEVVECATRQTLGRALGRQGVAVVGITDTGLASRIRAAHEG